MANRLGERVRELRRQRGFSSVHTLSRVAGVGVQVLVNLERYDLPPKRRATAERIARALGCTIADLGWHGGDGDDAP